MEMSERHDNTIPELTRRLRQYGRSDYYPLHMPGHKRQAYGLMPEDVYEMDITEIDGFDNLHQAEGILKVLQEKAARLYNADESFYLINGSTCGILSAISAAVPQGGHILMTRNCHKSAYHACYLRKLSISYLYPDISEAYDICEAITPAQVEQALTDNPGVDAVLIVSPTYEGRLAAVDEIAKVVHQRGIPLIVDEAHGAHLGFYEGFGKNSCMQGADLVIHSVHKTLPAMTQTALLHVNGQLIDRKKLCRFLHIYQSSSPSYVLMASIENALWQVETNGNTLFGRFICNWQKMCRELSACRYLDVMQPDEKQDVGKLLVSVKKTGLSGQQLYDMLLLEYHLQLEMAAPGYVLAMFTVGDSEEGFSRMTRALLEIDKRLQTKNVTPWMRGHVFKEVSEQNIPFFEAWDSDAVLCPLQECAGRYAGDFINLYPPGTPMIVPGERISEVLVVEIERCLKQGLQVQGLYEADGKMFLPVLVRE